MKIQRLSVIIPCYQERENARRFKEEVFDCLRNFDFEKEYLLVDDGSTDGTLQELEKLAKENPAVTVLSHSSNRGLGACLLTAIPRARGDAILTLDADLTFHPREFSKLLDAYNDNIDCVGGSAILGHLEGVNPVRKLLTMIVNSIYRILLGKKFTAVSSIFRLYRTATLKKYQLKSQSFQINAEILIRLIQDQKHIEEVPVTLTKRIYGVSKINFIREILNHLAMFGQLLAWRFSFRRD